VKDFMREYGKLAGVTAAGAFLISLVIGLASGNLFGVALARALLFALLFAGLAAGARYVVTKYLSEPVGATPPDRGQKIDITLPEENPIAPGRAGAYARESRAPQEQPPALETGYGDLAAEETGSADAPPLDLEQPGSGGSMDVGVDSLDDELPPLTDDDSAAVEEAGSAADSVEEAESVPEDGPGSSAAGGDDALQADADLGRLPDISSLGGSSSGARASPPPRAAQTPEDAMKGALGARDPATLARAIRTVLKREEKG
jgi:hypothetical protein